MNTSEHAAQPRQILAVGRNYAAHARELGHDDAPTTPLLFWKPVGSLRLASSQDRWTEIKRAATTAKSFGLEMHLIGPKEAQDMFPIMTTDGVVGAAYIPSDGYIDPSGITQALAKGARMNGAAIVEGVRITGIEMTGRRATAVLTDQGRVRAEIIVNAAGCGSTMKEYAHLLGGQAVPLQSEVADDVVHRNDDVQDVS